MAPIMDRTHGTYKPSNKQVHDSQKLVMIYIKICNQSLKCIQGGPN